MNQKIGIFDSGSGGLSTLTAIRKFLPNAEYFYIGDVKHCPYGTKNSAELLEITSSVVERLAKWGATIIIIACNTATTRCIHQLRQRFPKLTFIGTEPALKVAHDQGYKHPLLLCTPATARASSVQKLVTQNYPNAPLFIGPDSPYPASKLKPNSSQVTILPCVGLADTIEQTLTNPKEIQLLPNSLIPNFSVPTSDKTNIEQKLQTLFSQLPPDIEYDSIVLGCTHYVLIRHLVQSFFPSATLVDGNQGVAKYTKLLLSYPHS